MTDNDRLFGGWRALEEQRFLAGQTWSYRIVSVGYRQQDGTIRTRPYLRTVSRA